MFYADTRRNDMYMTNADGILFHRVFFSIVSDRVSDLMSGRLLKRVDTPS